MSRFIRATTRMLVLGTPLLLATLGPRSATAQTDPRLTAAVREAQEGASDSARATVQRILASTVPTDSLYPQILYTAAMISNDAADMRRQLLRVAIEFPMSAWADDALLRLAQVDYANRELDAATRHLERLAIDFPDTPLYAHAAYWAGMTYFDQQKHTEACRWLAEGMSRSGGDVEIRVQLGYLQQRCNSGATPVASPDSAPLPGSIPTSGATPAAAQVRSAPPNGTAASRGKFSVQVAAVGTRAAAATTVRKLEPLGYEVVTVEEGGLYKVRAGAFATRAAAQQAAAAIEAKLGGDPFVVSR